ncbi:MAG TPA: NUDIX domain-containing protein [Candidatus Gracilibacteria bacterium]|nr:NUDIX domain-containing protein [Candidatus Gracilibacteria bacterium]
MPESAKLALAVHLFLINSQNQILLLERLNTGLWDGSWSVPAGRVDVGESLTQAMIREAQEEVGVKIQAKDLGKPLIMHHKDSRGERIYGFFICGNWQGEVKNCEPEKCSQIKWVEMEKLPIDFLDHVKEALELKLKGETYCEYGF